MSAKYIVLVLGLAIAVGVIIGWIIWGWFAPAATFEFGREKLPDGTLVEPSVYVQVDGGDKLVFVNNDTKEEQILVITFDAGSLEPGQPDVDPGNKLFVPPGETKSVIVNKDLAPGKVITMTFNAEATGDHGSGEVIVRGGP